MKALNILLVFLILSLTSLQAQIIPSSCEAADSIEEDYFIDATQLALRKIFEQNLPEKDSVAIPAAHVDTILDAMIAVYNIDIPERDSVIDIFRIYTKHSIPMGDIIARINQSFSFSNPTLASLMSKYGITAEFLTIGLNDYVLFGVSKKYNMHPLIEVISAIQGVNYAETNQFQLDGNNIESTIYPDYVELNYSFAWGDCMSGCMYRRYWEFKVYYDCSVEFVKSYGSTDPPIPPSLSLKEKIDFEEFNLFPNPAYNELSFTLNDNSSNITLEVFDVSGKQVKFIQYSNSGNGEFNYSMDISHLNSGLYFCKFSNREKRVIKKFVKE
jgi:hypothetical protein